MRERSVRLHVAHPTIAVCPNPMLHRKSIGISFWFGRGFHFLFFILILFNPFLSHSLSYGVCLLKTAMHAAISGHDHAKIPLNKRATPQEDQPAASESAKQSATKKPESAAPSSSAANAKSSDISFVNDKSQSVTAFPTPPSSTTTTPPYQVFTTPSQQIQTQTPEDTASSTNAATATASVAMAEDSSSISGGAIGGIVVAVVAALALSLIAILFVKRRKRRTRRPSISHRVSSFGQNDFFAGPSATAPSQQPPMSQTYGSMNTPPPHVAAAGPVAAAEYYTPALTQPYAHQQPNSTFAPAPAFAATAASPPMTQQPPPPLPPQQDPWQHPPLGTYTVVSTYAPTLDDEIYVHPGDQVQVYAEYDDGWCLGANLTRGSTRGVFPMHCIQGSTSPSMASSTAGGASLSANDPRLSKRGSSLYNT
ncbi:hypothetical protein BDB00DRAFT_217435 [Zychaea mexicana]|uniref:uncharacterized protein n=1 Tax=Zychaea mexicana TaxID=64656 RepID=UPI0022FF3371|nr:uncharacterized protein BDB00DRAFT_217435 [Zychaea mexicana]KAI9472868.1 hypothetical protein BDB00DRAFT_217435 [Zychaea mexicana]